MNGYQIQTLLEWGAMAEQNMLRMTTPVVYTAAIAIIALTGRASVIAYTGAFLLGHACCSIASITVMRRRFQPTLRSNFELLPKVLACGSKNYVASVAAQTSLRLDQLVISTLFSRAEMGFYSVSVSCGGVLVPLYSSIGMIVFPVFIKKGLTGEGQWRAYRGSSELC